MGGEIMAIVMLIFGCVVLYGGLFYCVNIALRKKKREN
jgi:hypothetical protein